jgi:hypothetical protein
MTLVCIKHDSDFALPDMIIGDRYESLDESNLSWRDNHSTIFIVDKENTLILCPKSNLIPLDEWISMQRNSKINILL